MASTPPSKASKLTAQSPRIIPQEFGYRGLIGIYDEEYAAEQKQDILSAQQQSEENGLVEPYLPADESAEIPLQSSQAVPLSSLPVGLQTALKDGEVIASGKEMGGKLISPAGQTMRADLYLYNQHTKEVLRISRKPETLERQIRLQDHSCFQKSLNAVRQGCVQAAFTSPLTDKEFRLMDVAVMQKLLPEFISKTLDIKASDARDIKIDAYDKYAKTGAVGFASRPGEEASAIAEKLQTFKALRAAADRAIQKLENGSGTAEVIEEVNAIRPVPHGIFDEAVKDLSIEDHLAFVDNMHDLLSSTAEFYRQGLSAVAVYNERMQDKVAERLGLLIDTMTAVQIEVKASGKFELRPWMVESLTPGSHVCKCDDCVALPEKHLETSLGEQMRAKMEEEGQEQDDVMEDDSDSAWRG